MNTQTIHVVRLNVGSRLRRVDRKKVKALADSITEIGLLNPISVSQIGDEYLLVAGRHRLEAAKLLGWDKVPAVVVELDDVDRLLAEIDENLIRNDLSDLERSEHLAERKRLYLLKHPETKRGGDRRSEEARSNGQIVRSFSADTADRVGVDERSIRRDVQIAESIPEDVRDAIRDTPIAESKTDLLEISRLPEEAQREVIATADLASKTSVRETVAKHKPRKPAPAPKPEEETHTTEVITTVEAFAVAIASLFSVSDRRRLIRLIADDIKEEAAFSGN